MVHFRIHFSYPLLLLVFLFGAVMTALLYFRLSKKYRKNRNRITSIVLHLIVLEEMKKDFETKFVAFAYEDICKDIFANLCKQGAIDFVPVHLCKDTHI